MLRPRNWNLHQHFKRRRPNWIKAHRTLLDDANYWLMSEPARALLLPLWLLASESAEGNLPDSRTIAFRFRIYTVEKVERILGELIAAQFLETDDEKLLPPPPEDPEAPDFLALPAPVKDDDSPTQNAYGAAAKALFAYWKERTGKDGAKWTQERRGHLLRRLKEESADPGAALDGLKLAVDGAVTDPFFNGSETGKSYTEFESIFVHKGRNRIEKLQGLARNPQKRISQDSKAGRIDAQARALIAESRAKALTEGNLP